MRKIHFIQFFIFLLLVSRPMAQEGILGPLENLVGLYKDSYKKMIELGAKNQLTLSQLKKAESVRINTLFLESIFFYTSKEKLALAKNACQLYTLLEKDLLINHLGPIDQILVDVKIEKKNVTGIISKGDFLKYNYSRSCLKNRELNTLYQIKNLKITLKKANLSSPKNKKSCESQFLRWKKSPHLPHFCSLHYQFKNAKSAEATLGQANKLSLNQKLRLRNFIKVGLSLRKQMSSTQKYYIDSLCPNILNSEKFCKSFLMDSFWARSLKKDRPSFNLKALCDDLLGRATTKSNLKKCIALITKDPKRCGFARVSKTPGLYPRPNCLQLEQSYKVNKLKANFKDCPGKLDHQSITNAGRLYHHFNYNKIDPKIYSDECSIRPIQTLAQMNIDYKSFDLWPLKVCFYNPYQKQDICLKYIPGKNEDRAESEIAVIGSILKKLKGASFKLKCKIVSEKKYNPRFLEYKSGCFITFDPANCNPIHCPKKVIYNQTEIKEIRYSGKIQIDYIPNSFKNTRYSIIHMLRDLYVFKSSPIHHYSQILFALNKDKESLVHGVGCLEDLLPHYFHRKALTQCHPSPFIISGHFTKKNNRYLVAHTTLDAIQYPRNIPWHRIFSAVKNFQLYHPLKSWALYAIKK